MRCYYVIMFKWFLRQKLQGPPEDEGGDYNFEDLHSGCKLIKQI
jgi:hypothetical protein